MKQNLEILAHDLRYAARGLARNRTFTMAALLAIALGTGAGTAVFSVVDRILFRGLPYADAERLVSFGMVAPVAPQEFMLGYDYLDWRDRQTPFAGLGAWTDGGDCDLTEANPIRLRCAAVDAGLLPALGVHPFRGRNFTAAEDRPNAPKAALLSYGLWRSRFGGDPGVVGRTVPLDGQSRTVVGVLPREFELPNLAAADVLVPLALDEAEQRTRRTAILLWSVGRLKAGVTPAAAGAALQPLFQDALRYVSPEFRKDVTLRIRPIRDRQVQDARLASWMLLAAVAAVLLVACGNVANLLLARAATLRRELGIRAALGAGRGRLARQALTESLLLALSGGAAGCALAFLLLRLFLAIAPEGILRLRQAEVDGRVLLFSLALALLSSVLFGLAPALANPRPDWLAGSRVTGAGHHRFREGLVALQIGGSVILLTGAGMLLRSLWNLQNQALGIRTGSVLTATVTLGHRSYPDDARRQAFFEEMEARLGRIPGVASFAVSSSLPPARPPGGPMLYGAIDVAGRPRFTDGTGGSVAWRSVTPGYFAALGIPILRGRGFQEQDRDPDRYVAILSDTMVRRMFPGEDPVGKQIRPGRIGPWLTVVGVAGNVKNSGLAERDDPEYYVVRKHSPSPGRTATVILRGPIEMRAMAEQVRAGIAALDPTLPVNIETLDGRVSRLAARPRFNALVLAIFAGIGLLLSAIGLYGVVSFVVAQRTREIGVRMALGATPASIRRLVLGAATRWMAAGAVLGVAGWLYAGILLQALLFRVAPRDPWAPAAALAVLGGFGVVAAWVPARRAARVDPVVALRLE